MPIGGEAMQLTVDPAPDWAPGWSPDGRTLAFYSYRTGGCEIFAMPATGGAATQLTMSKGLDAGSHKDRSERAATSLVGKRGTLGIMQPATDGKFLYFPWRDDLADIWVMEVVQR